MIRNLLRPIFFTASLLSCFIVALSSGCASGGYKLTRQYAGFVNRQSIIIRIVLYILTSIVFLVTLLVDSVIFNTMDFWNGTVSQGTYEFKEDAKTYQVKHEVLPDTQLKRSTINVFDDTHKLLQNVVLKETPSHEVELYVDGYLRTKVKNFSGLPVASFYDAKGIYLNDELVLTSVPQLARM